MTTSRLEFAKFFARTMHFGQKYAGKPYIYHLDRVERILARFGFTDEFYACCAWLHDIIEDCDGVDYNKIKAGFGQDIADVVFAVTNNLGRNRKERFKYTYPKIWENDRALVIKLADRIANIEQGLENGGGKFDMYKKEWPDFKEALYIPDSDSRVNRMWRHLDNLFEET